MRNEYKCTLAKVCIYAVHINTIIYKYIHMKINNCTRLEVLLEIHEKMGRVVEMCACVWKQIQQYNGHILEYVDVDVPFFHLTVVKWFFRFHLIARYKHSFHSLTINDKQLMIENKGTEPKRISNLFEQSSYDIYREYRVYGSMSSVVIIYVEFFVVIAVVVIVVILSHSTLELKFLSTTS